MLENVLKAALLEYHYQRMLLDCYPSDKSREWLVNDITMNWLKAPKTYYISKYRN